MMIRFYLHSLLLLVRKSALNVTVIFSILKVDFQRHQIDMPALPSGFSSDL